MKTSFFTTNRERLIRQTNGGTIVLSAYTKMQRGSDTAFSFEQEANFWWLSGINTPDWWLIIDGTRHKSYLVVPEVSRTSQIFDGSLSPEHAKEISGVDTIISHDEAANILRDLANRHSVVHTLGDQPHAEYLDFTLNPAPKKMHDMLERMFNAVQDCRKDLAQLRAIKQPEEIIALQQAIDVTIDAFVDVKSALTTFRYEHEIEAEFTYLFRKQGNVKHAYDPIVAAGRNACTLHYDENSAKLKKRELILLDIGARQSGYPADITRTYAIGEPTKRQTRVHEAVASAQAHIISLLGPDVSVEQYQREVDSVMMKTLLSVGLMSNDKDLESYHRYFPHAISHGLGVDVHDSLGAPKYLQPGMVLTVEPGIYIPEEGIGVRIEDDILITQTGYTNLSARLSTEL